jgi:hypothetical protein
MLIIAFLGQAFTEDNQTVLYREKENKNDFYLSGLWISEPQVDGEVSGMWSMGDTC